MNKSRIILFFLLMLVYSTSMAGLEISISFQKSTYFLLEPILIRYKVTNTGNSNIRVAEHMLAGMFVVQDEQKRKYQPMATDDTIDFGYKIAPSQVMAGFADILGYGAPLNKTSYTPALQKGSYTVYMEINPPEGGHYVSETLKFEVVEPSGTEKKAMSLILGADSLRILKQKEASYRKMLEVCRNYPGSVYNQYAFFRASIMYPFGDKNELIELNREFIDKYPNSNYLNYALLDILQYYQSKKDKKGYLEELKLLMEKYPDAEVSRKAKKRLETVDKLEF